MECRRNIFKGKRPVFCSLLLSVGMCAPLCLSNYLLRCFEFSYNVTDAWQRFAPRNAISQASKSLVRIAYLEAIIVCSRAKRGIDGCTSRFVLLKTSDQYVWFLAINMEGWLGTHFQRGNRLPGIVVVSAFRQLTVEPNICASYSEHLWITPWNLWSPQKSYETICTHMHVIQCTGPDMCDAALRNHTLHFRPFVFPSVSISLRPTYDSEPVFAPFPFPVSL